MADTKVSALAAAASVVAANEFPINEAGTSKKVTAQQIADFAVPPSTASTAQQVITAATVTYLTGSGITIPPAGMVVGQQYRWFIYVTKTAAGVVAPIWTPRIGTNKTTGDATVLTITGTAQVATASGTLIIVSAVVRSVGASGVIVAAINTGAASFGIGGNGASGAFNNSAVAGQFFGLCVNTGTSAAWTVEAVYGEVIP